MLWFWFYGSIPDSWHPLILVMAQMTQTTLLFGWSPDVEKGRLKGNQVVSEMVSTKNFQFWTNKCGNFLKVSIVDVETKLSSLVSLLPEEKVLRTEGHWDWSHALKIPWPWRCPPQRLHRSVPKSTPPRRAASPAMSRSLGFKNWHGWYPQQQSSMLEKKVHWAALPGTFLVDPCGLSLNPRETA